MITSGSAHALNFLPCINVLKTKDHADFFDIKFGPVSILNS